MIIVTAIIGLFIGGGIVAVCGKILGTVIDDEEEKIVGNFKRLFSK